MDPEKEAFDIEMVLDEEAMRELDSNGEKWRLIAEEHSEQEEAWLFVKEESP